jgi:hypothetical protein
MSLITAKELSIHAVSSEEIDPYGKNGFSSVTGEFEVSDKSSFETLSKAFKEKMSITLKCVLLEITGVIWKLAIEPDYAKGTISVENIYLKSAQPQEQAIRIEVLMKATRLPISICHANCPKCNLPTEFKMFESGAGGDFETYVGEKSASIYRVNLGQIGYLNKKINELLKPALEREGSLRKVPDQLRCKVCGSIFFGRAMIDGDEIIEAFEL